VARLLFGESKEGQALMKQFQKMIQVDEQGIDLHLAKKLSKEVLPNIQHPHAVYKHQAIINPKKMRKLMQLEDIVSLEPTVSKASQD
jgi:hypothetical protein